MNSLKKPEPEPGNETVTLTFNKKEGLFLIKGRKEDVDEILRLFEDLDLDLKLSYKGWCG